MTKVPEPTARGVERLRSTGAAAVDPLAMRRCVSRFATGVVVVSYAGPDGPRGITVNSFTSVSLAPPLILVCVARSSRSHALLPGHPFAVNILGADQIAVARHFAGADPNLAIAWAEGPTPSVAGSLARLFCEPWERLDGGDHSLFLGRVVGLDHREGDALAYHESRFTSLRAPRGWLPNDGLLEQERHMAWM
ncbi:flavin reductase family protein [Actinocorallia sp. API 0066]|uniref:flavin reductase family protein n=1 Tax=Actinocorallia sp. API 0066 TaxID=2896846 RepID=UPI001E283ED7|nr:flavin reductase family protein [Actinocorallia sp. API 0066]MCD0447978.1 flavin reductase family protein [Actinocorallia sp. API 0066]